MKTSIIIQIETLNRYRVLFHTFTKNFQIDQTLFTHTVDRALNVYTFIFYTLLFDGYALQYTQRVLGVQIIHALHYVTHESYQLPFALHIKRVLVVQIIHALHYFTPEHYQVPFALTLYLCLCWIILLPPIIFNVFHIQGIWSRFSLYIGLYTFQAF